MLGGPIERIGSLDPPRHLYLHTKTSLAHLTAEVGLGIDSVVFDSTERQLLGSELWKRNIALSEKAESRAEVEARREEFALEAVRLNDQEDDDMAAFYLRSRATA